MYFLQQFSADKLDDTDCTGYSLPALSALLALKIHPLPLFALIPIDCITWVPQPYNFKVGFTMGDSSRKWEDERNKYCFFFLPSGGLAVLYIVFYAFLSWILDFLWVVVTRFLSPCPFRLGAMASSHLC